MIRLKALLLEQKEDPKSGWYTMETDPTDTDWTQQAVMDTRTLSAASSSPSGKPMSSLTKELGKWIEPIAKDIYYKWWQNGKACEIDASSKDSAFLQAKRDGCNFFKWQDVWYNTETDMPIEQELKAYAKKNYSNYVVVDYFNMFQSVGGGFGHIQAWSLKEPEYQINPMPLNADIRSLVPMDPSSVGIYNQAVEELYDLKFESLVLRMSDSEYAHFKSTVGAWKSVKQKWLENNKTTLSDNLKDWFNNYNILFNNCAHYVQQSVLPDSNKLSRALNTIPWDAYNEIKSYYYGRSERKASGLRLPYKKIAGVGEQVPSKYEDPEYVIKNAETIVSNRWTIVVQQTLWAQYDTIKRNADRNSNYQKAADAINQMHQSGFVQNGNKWDKIFGQDTKAALEAVRDLSSYKPVPIPN